MRRFAVRAIAATALPYAVLWAALSLVLERGSPAENAVFLVPALGIILAARGVSLGERVGAVLVAVAAFVVLESAFTAMWTRSLAPGARPLAFGLDGSKLTGLYQAFLLLYPLVVAELFARGSLARLFGGEHVQRRSQV
jgi:hypothetical protein